MNSPWGVVPLMPVALLVVLVLVMVSITAVVRSSGPVRSAFNQVSSADCRLPIDSASNPQPQTSRASHSALGSSPI